MESNQVNIDTQDDPEMSAKLTKSIVENLAKLNTNITSIL